MRALVLIAVLVVVACGSGSNAIPDGTYGGVMADGTEVEVDITAPTVKVNGFNTDVDDSQRQLTFDVVMPVRIVSAPRSKEPHWVCEQEENGDAMKCVVTTNGRNETVELMRE